MDARKLVKMANDIAAFFDAEPDREAALAGIAGHLKRFWDPRMRRDLLGWVDQGGEGLRESVLAAVQARRGDLGPAAVPAAAAAAPTAPAPARAPVVLTPAVPDVLPGSVVTARIQSKRASDPAPSAREDQLAVEAPLEVRIGKSANVLMRTPGSDEDLVRGMLLSEGLIGRLEDIVELARPPGLTGDEVGNVIRVTLAPGRTLAPPERMFYGSSSCGACGKGSIAALAVRAQPCTSTLTVSAATLHALPATLRAAQAMFRETGGVHASALFSADGTLVALREDVGRHNALDKLIGWALAQNLVPLAQHVLLVSGRVSYDILQKSIAAGIPVVAAIGAPSSLAVDLAEQFATTVVGFLGPASLNVYSSPQRVLP